MKTLITLSVLTFFIYSCSKEEVKQQSLVADQAQYFGDYHSASGDTATISAGGNGMLKIRFASKNPVALRTSFDSLRVNSDMSFICNEFTTTENPGTKYCYTAVGSGKIGENTLDFNITLYSASTIKFSGVKKR